MIPILLKRYFWDVDLAQLDVEKHSRFIIERILEYGRPEAITENIKPGWRPPMVGGTASRTFPSKVL